MDVTELSTFPESDTDFSKLFVVPTAWLARFLDGVANMRRFLQEYLWDETVFIYEAAKNQGVLVNECETQDNL